MPAETKFLRNKLTAACGKDAADALCDAINGVAGGEDADDFGAQLAAVAEALCNLVNARAGFTPKITKAEMKAEIAKEFRKRK